MVLCYIVFLEVRHMTCQARQGRARQGKAKKENPPPPPGPSSKEQLNFCNDISPPPQTWPHPTHPSPNDLPTPSSIGSGTPTNPFLYCNCIQDADIALPIMVKLEEVVDEEFMREQAGPHDDDDWDTDSGMKIWSFYFNFIFLSVFFFFCNFSPILYTSTKIMIIQERKKNDTLTPHHQIPTPPPSSPARPTRRFSSASPRCRT